MKKILLLTFMLMSMACFSQVAYLANTATRKEYNESKKAYDAVGKATGETVIAIAGGKVAIATNSLTKVFKIVSETKQSKQGDVTLVLAKIQSVDNSVELYIGISFVDNTVKAITFMSIDMSSVLVYTDLTDVTDKYKSTE